MPVPALDRKKPNPSSTNQDESNGEDHQSRNPQQQIYGGIHSHQREHAGEVVNSTQREQPQQLRDPSPSKQHPTPYKNPQGNTQPVYPSYGQTSQPPRYPPIPTPQQQPKQSNPFTPRGNDPTRTQDPQSINFTILIYPPPQNTENQPPQLPTQPVILPTYNKPPDKDTAHKQPQPTTNITGQAPSTSQEYPPPKNQISTKHKPPDGDTYSERNSAAKVDDPPTNHPSSYISTERNQQQQLRDKNNARPIEESPSAGFNFPPLAPSRPPTMLQGGVRKEEPSEGQTPSGQKIHLKDVDPPNSLRENLHSAAVVSNGGNNNSAPSHSSSLDPTQNGPVVTVFPVKDYNLSKPEEQQPTAAKLLPNHAEQEQTRRTQEEKPSPGGCPWWCCCCCDPCRCDPCRCCCCCCRCFGIL